MQHCRLRACRFKRLVYMLYLRFYRTTAWRGHDYSPPPVATLLPRQQMQSLTQAPHRLGPTDRPGRRKSIAVFSLRVKAFLAMFSILLLLASDIELNPLPNFYHCGKPIHRVMELLHKQVPQATSLQRLQTAFHRSCSGLSRDAAAAALARNGWICGRCTTTQPHLRQGPLQTNMFVSKSANRVSHSALRILQWNADGISTKAHLLGQRLHLEKIDTCMIHETKLSSKDSVPASRPSAKTAQHHTTEAGYSPS